MKSRIMRAALIAIVSGLLALAGTAPLAQPGGLSFTASSVELGS